MSAVIVFRLKLIILFPIFINHEAHALLSTYKLTGRPIIFVTRAVGRLWPMQISHLFGLKCNGIYELA